VSLERTTAAIVAIGDDRSALAHLTLVVERVSRLASLAGTSFICLSAMRIRAWRHGPLLRLLVLVVLQLILAATSWLYSSDILTRHAVASYALMPHDDDAGAGVAADAKAAPCFERAWFVVLSLLRWSTDAWLIFMQINRGLRAAYRAARLGAGEEFSLSSEISWAVRISGTALLAGSLTLPFATAQHWPPNCSHGALAARPLWAGAALHVPVRLRALRPRPLLLHGPRLQVEGDAGGGGPRWTPAGTTREAKALWRGATAPWGGATVPRGGATVPRGRATAPRRGAKIPRGGATAPRRAATAPPRGAARSVATRTGHGRTRAYSRHGPYSCLRV